MKKISLVLLLTIATLTTYGCSKDNEINAQESTISSVVESSSVPIEDKESSISQIPSSMPSGSSKPIEESSSTSSTFSSTEIEEPIEDETVKNEISIIVRQKNLIESKEIEILEEKHIESILAIADTATESELYHLPDTGGQSYDILITKDGITEIIAIVEDEYDGYGMAKVSREPNKRRWYYVSLEAYPYLESLFSEGANYTMHKSLEIEENK